MNSKTKSADSKRQFLQHVRTYARSGAFQTANQNISLIVSLAEMVAPGSLPKNLKKAAKRIVDAAPMARMIPSFKLSEMEGAR